MEPASSAVEVFAFSGLISGDCSCTTMLSIADAMFSVKSTVCFRPSPCGHRVALLSLEAPHFDFYRI